MNLSLEGAIINGTIIEDKCDEKVLLRDTPLSSLESITSPLKKVKEFNIFNMGSTATSFAYFMVAPMLSFTLWVFNYLGWSFFTRLAYRFYKRQHKTGVLYLTLTLTLNWRQGRAGIVAAVSDAATVITTQNTDVQVVPTEGEEGDEEGDSPTNRMHLAVI